MKHNQKAGLVRESVQITRSLAKTTGDIINDIAVGLADVIGGVTNGLGMITKHIGDTLSNLTNTAAITSTKVFRNAGNLGLTISKELGNVIEVIPILGRPAAYIVEGAGKGVYYVVTNVGGVAGKSLKTLGKVGEEASDLVVFTLVSGSDLTEDTIKEAGDVVKDITYLVNNKKSKKSKTGKKSKKSSKSKKSKTRKSKK